MISFLFFSLNLLLLLLVGSGVSDSGHTQTRVQTVPSSSLFKGTRDPSYEVFEVNTENFDMFVSSSPTVLLEFYAPWCRHCIQFEGLYKMIGNSLSVKNVKVGKVNSSTNQALSARFAIQSIPALFLIKGTETYRYSGLLSHDSVVDYATAGHRKDTSLPMWESPMGPFGKFKGLLVNIGLRMYAMPSEFSKKYGLSAFSGVILSVVLVVFLLLVAVFSFVYLTI